ncbi:MAG: hypothetical protein ACK5MK_04400 [Dysgonomonas sp.]
MQAKRIVKIIIFLIFTIAVLIAGYTMFKRLDYNKGVFDTNIHSFIPGKTTSILQINRKIEDMASHLGTLETIATRLSSSFSYPACYITDLQGSAIILKINKEQEQIIQNKLKKEIYTAFPAKEKDYKGVKMTFYPSQSSDFLACIFYKGIFACSYNYKILENIIDATEKNNFFSNKALNELSKYTSASYTANIFVNDTNLKCAYNYIKNGNNIRLEGFATPSSFISAVNCPGAKDNSMQATSRAIPDLFSALEIQKNISNIQETEICYFSAPSYKIYLGKEHEVPVYFIRFNNSRFSTFDMMNTVEKRMSGQHLSLKGSIEHTKYNLYTSAPQFSKQFFKQTADTTYFSFKDNFLAYSVSKESLYSYVLSKLPSDASQPSQTETLSDNINYLFIGRGKCNGDYSEFLPRAITLQRDSNSITNIQCQPDNNLLKVSISINNYN